MNKRYSGGLQFLSNYTWSKTMDNLNSAFGDTWGQNGGRPMDYYNLSLDKSVSDSDRTHAIKIGSTYELPFGKGRPWGADMNRAADFAVGGWTLQYIGNFTSGQPLGFGGTGTAAGNFATQRAVLVNPDGKPLSIDWDSSNFDMSKISTPGTTAHKFFDTSLIRNPGRFERGNSAYRYGQLRLPWTFNNDLSLQKNFFPVESVKIQLRVEALNAFNQHRFSSVNTNAANPLFGRVGSTAPASSSSASAPIGNMHP
ncbi:MAG: hypothetical protein U5J83_06060 [Bryobacterales bacterium]|nr:hypothetical protein [Bryobacterales bacterium]